MRKLVFIVEFGFTKRDYYRFGFDFFAQNNVDTLVLDVSSLLRPEYLSSYTPPDPIEMHNMKIINSWEVFRKTIKKLNKEDLIICMIETRTESNGLFSILNISLIRYGFWFSGELPMPPSLFASFMQFYLVNKLRILLRKTRKYFSKSIENIYTPSFIVVAGKKASEKARRSFPDSNLKLIQVHSLDYDKFIEVNNKDRTEGELTNYSIFLDDDKPFHPDNIVIDTGKGIDSKNYYRELNDFFDHYEKTGNSEVIIAGHPRADYKARGNPFEGRKLEMGSTIQLIKDSDYVIGHNSTSLGVAALFKKPIILLTSDTFNSYNRRYVKAFSKALATKVVNISHKRYKKQDLSSEVINESKYKNYIIEYLKGEETQEILSWEIFNEEIKSL